MFKRISRSFARTLMGPVTFLLTPAVVLTPTDSVYAGDKLPSGASVLDNYVKSTGGKRAYKRVKNRVTELSATMSAMGNEMTMKLVEYAAPPRMVYRKVEMQMGTTEEGCDGEHTWRMAPPMMGGTAIREGDEHKQSFRDAFFNKDVDWREIYEKAEVVDDVEFDGSHCYKMLMTPKDGVDNEETRYYEKDTGLLRGTEAIISTPQAGDLPISVKFQDYKEVDGILYPHTMIQSIMGMEYKMTVDSIKHNVELPEDRFALPEPVKALLAETPGDAKPEPDKEKKG